MHKIWTYQFNLASKIISNFPKTIITLVFLISVFFAWQASKIQIKPDFIHILDKKSSTTQSYLKTVEILGSSGWLFVVAEHADKNILFKFSDELAQLSLENKQIRYAVQFKHDPWLRKNFVSFLNENETIKFKKIAEDKFEELNHFNINPKKNSDDQNFLKLFSNEKEENYIYQKDKNRIYVLIKPNGTETNPEFVKNFIQNVRIKIENLNKNSFNNQLYIHYGGQYQLQFEGSGR